MTNHKIIRMLMVLAGMLLAGCSGDDDEKTAKNEEIRLNADVWQMMEGTRALTIDNNTALQAKEIKIDAYYNGTETKYLDGAKMIYNSSAWKFWSGDPGSETHYYWPIEGSVYDPSSANITVSSLDFVGFCPFEKPTYIGTPTYSHSTGVSFSATMPTEEISSVHYMTPTSQSSLQEYLIAVLNTQTYTTQTDAGGALPLVFKHPFALIKFVITAGSGTHVQVNSISIADLYTSGTCTYDGADMTWSGHSGSAAMSQTGLNLKYGTGSTQTTLFMVIPKNYGTKTLTINGTWDDWSNVTKDISADVAFNWEPGYIYTYNLTVTKYALKVDATKFTEQW